LKGDWDLINEHFVDELIDKNLDMGDIWFVSLLSHWNCWLSIYKGNLDLAKSYIIRLEDIYRLYENRLSLTLKYLVLPGLLMETRKLDESLLEIEKGIEFAKEVGLGTSMIHLFSCQAWIWLLKGDIDAAEKCLEQADRIGREVKTVPWMLSHFVRSRVECDLRRLESCIEHKNVNFTEVKKKALRSAKTFLKQSRKVAQHRTESYKFMGRYYFFIGSQGKARRWWQKAIEEGTRLGARLELSRAYFEVGMRLLSAQRKDKAVRDINAEEYLEKARVMFEEMDLQWDLAVWREKTTV